MKHMYVTIKCDVENYLCFTSYMAALNERP